MKVSIVIPTWNGEDTIAECLRGVFEQQVDFEFDVLVIDSASTDRTAEIARRFPVRFLAIDQRDFDHGDTRNLGARLTDGDFIVFLVQDAYPERRDWLYTLVNKLKDPQVGGAFCRIVPRLTAGPLVKRGVQGDLCFDPNPVTRQIVDAEAYQHMDPLARRIFINFNDVASCLRRDAWRRLPFARVQFGEDLLWARGALEAGYKIVYAPDAPVVHSHEYDPKTLRKRTRIDAWLNRAYLDRECIRRRRDVLIMTHRVAKQDRAWLREHGYRGIKYAKLAALSFWYHFLEFAGFWQGSKTGDRLTSPQAVPSERLKILFVVHGFPPETTAGTEVLTLSLAKALLRRGHDVTVFHRVGDPSLPNYSLHESTFDGLKVIRIANHLAFRNIEETYRNREVEARFREVLLRERPDVVHFEHMIHLSATLPSVCKELGIANVVTLNDFWFRCPRVQLIRPDRRLCSGKPPILGCAACVGEKPQHVDALRAVSRPFRRLLHRAAERYQLLVAKSPKWFRKRWSDLACIAKRPRTMIAELLKADFVFAPSRFLKQRMVEAGVPADRLIVSDYGMEEGWLAGYRRAERATGDATRATVRFGFVGSLVWYKGLETLARAFQRIPFGPQDPRAELHIHGDTGENGGLPEFRETRARIEEHVTRPGLFFHGRYSPKDLAGVLAGIDVLVVPSVWYENSPLAVHEAFQAGVPVLVSDLGGMRDLVTDGKGGLRFAPANDADLAAKMSRFLHEPNLAAELVKNAPAVKTVDDNAAEMEVKYKQAIGLHLAHSTVFATQGSRFAAAVGPVETLGGDMVLLRPAASATGAVQYEVVTDGDLSVDLCVTTWHLGGESAVVQGGEVRVNGATVLWIEPHTGNGTDRSAMHRAPVELKKGRNRIEVRNRVSGPGGGIFHLRVREVALHRTNSRIVPALEQKA